MIDLKFFYWRTRDGRLLHTRWIEMAFAGVLLLFAVTPSGKNAWAADLIGQNGDPIVEGSRPSLCPPGYEFNGVGACREDRAKATPTKDDIDAINKRLDALDRTIGTILCLASHINGSGGPAAKACGL